MASRHLEVVAKDEEQEGFQDQIITLSEQPRPVHSRLTVEVKMSKKSFKNPKSKTFTNRQQLLLFFFLKL
jgi:hypothetical protein